MVLAKGTGTDKKERTIAEFEEEFDTKDPSGVVKVIERKTRYCLRKDEGWQNEAKEDYNFALGDQWTTEEKEKLKEEDRPCLTFNKIESLIDLVGGWQRENSPRIQVFPEGGEDKIFSEIADKLLKAIDKWTKLNYKLDHMFDDGLVCGKGWLEMGISYDEDPIHGDLKFRNNVVYSILKDPDGKEYDRSDWEYMIKMSRQSKNKLKKLFPDSDKMIDGLGADNTDYLFVGETMKEGDADNYHLGKSFKSIDDSLAGSDVEEDEKYLLKEYWHRKYVTKYFVYDFNNARMEKLDTEEEAEAKKAEIMVEYDEKFQKAMQEYQVIVQASQAAQMASGQPGEVPEPPIQEEVNVQVLKRPVQEMWYAACAAGELLQEDIRSPFSPHYEDFPFFNYFAKWYVSAESDVLSIKGITRNIKDPQREVNKSRSQFLHILNTSANSGWIGDKNALSPTGWDDLKKMGSTPGVVVRKKTGTELQRIEPAGMSTGQAWRGEQGGQDIKEISGVNADAMAQTDKTTSGKAISLRIRQAMTILAKYFRNFRFTKELVGTAIYAMIPHVFDIHMVKKVIGQKYLEDNDISDGYLEAFMEQIKDGKYDLSITEADNSQTIRQETFDNLMDMVEKGMPIPPDVILEFSSMADSTDIIERVKEYQAQQTEAAQKQQ